MKLNHKMLLLSLLMRGIIYSNTKLVAQGLRCFN